MTESFLKEFCIKISFQTLKFIGYKLIFLGKSFKNHFKNSQDRKKSKKKKPTSCIHPKHDKQLKYNRLCPKIEIPFIIIS